MEIKWIPISERLPNVGETIRATQPDGEIWYLATYKSGYVQEVSAERIDDKDIIAWAELPQPYQPPHTYLDEFLKRLGTDRSKADEKTIEAIKEYTYVCDLIETDTKNNFCSEYGKECDGCWERKYKEVDNA